jgi:hypothetical protein
MIEVELPNGQIVEFPAGTAQATMQSAIRAHLASQPGEPQASEAPLSAAEPEMGGLNDMGMPQSQPAPQHSKLSTRDLIPAPQTILDLLGSGGLGAAGMMAGAPAGPAGSIALGGAGAAAGKRIARDVGSLFGLKGSEDYPAASESALDAAAGGAGPAVSAVARPLARAVTGVTKGAASRVQAARGAEKGTNAAVDQIEKLARASADDLAKNPLSSSVLAARGTSQAALTADIAKQASAARFAGSETTRKQVEAEVAQIAKTAGRKAELPQDAKVVSAILSGISFGSIEAAGLMYGAAVAASPLRAAAARRILRSENAVKWIAEKAQSGITPARLLGSLSTLAAVKGISPELKRDIRTLQGEGTPQRRESAGMRGDRDALEEMMRLK